MPGANYMGGKRNAARARGKDATGKAQRSHFGKKRFEILRTGLSKGQASVGRTADQVGIGLKGPPEISLAHAQRGPVAERYSAESASRLSQLFASPLARTPRRSPPRSASSRSKILRVLDADNSLAQRAQLDKILQIPDLLGLSTAQDRSRSSRLYQTPPCSSGYEYEMESTFTDVSPGIRTPWFLTFMSPCNETRELPRFVESHHTREPGESRRSPSNQDSIFVPMYMDSSPPPNAHDSGYAESWPDAHESLSCYEPARTPFYSASSSYLLSATSCDTRGALEQKWTGSFDGHYSGSWATSASPSQTQSPSPVHPSLSSTLPQARFLSDLPAMAEAPIQTEALSLPPSESPDHIWSGPSSYLPDSEDIPQASFSLSPPVNIVPSVATAEDPRMPYDEDAACDAGYSSTNDSVYSLLGDSLDHYEQDDASANVHFADLQEISLSCILNDALFEEADPWRALAGILDLPPTTVFRDIEPGPFCLINSCDRNGVGYMPAAAPHTRTLVLRSMGLELSAYAEDEHEVEDCFPDEPDDPRALVSEDSGAEYGRRLDPYSPFPRRPQHGPSTSEVVVNAALPTRELYEEPVPTLSGLLALNLEAPLEPSVDGFNDEREETRMVMACGNISLPAGVADHQRSSLMIAADEGRGYCTKSHDGLLDGPSLFLDDEPSEPEE